jgi:hypothetical protein
VCAAEICVETVETVMQQWTAGGCKQTG